MCIRFLDFFLHECFETFQEGKLLNENEPYQFMTRSQIQDGCQGAFLIIFFIYLKYILGHFGKNIFTWRKKKKKVDK